MQPVSQEAIRQFNENNLHLCATLARQSPETARILLGIDEAACKFYAQLSLDHIRRLARMDILLFGPRLNTVALQAQLADFATGEAPYAASHALLIAMSTNQLAAAQIESSADENPAGKADDKAPAKAAARKAA